jgi:hypothetical protein
MHVYIKNMRKKNGKKERVQKRRKEKGQLLHLLQIRCTYIRVRQPIIRN